MATSYFLVVRAIALVKSERIISGQVLTQMILLEMRPISNIISHFLMLGWFSVRIHAQSSSVAFVCGDVEWSWSCTRSRWICIFYIWIKGMLSGLFHFHTAAYKGEAIITKSRSTKQHEPWSDSLPTAHRLLFLGPIMCSRRYEGCLFHAAS